MSESIYLGHVNTSTDAKIKGKEIKIKNDLTFTIKSVLAKKIMEKNKNVRFKNKKACCHLSINIILHIAINDTGIVIKKVGTLTEKSNILKFDLIKLSANPENVRESEDI